MPKVMVVEDSLFMQNHLVKFLTEHSYEVVLAENGEEAVKTYRSDRPDAVLMDIAMPQMSGLAALAEIRGFDPQAKVIVLTAMDGRLLASHAVEMGAKDFLMKPVSLDKLLVALQKALE
jgi:two-component system, chemotaxis family, chemotaxis protein CheY